MHVTLIAAKRALAAYILHEQREVRESRYVPLEHVVVHSALAVNTHTHTQNGLRWPIIETQNVRQ